MQSAPSPSRPADRPLPATGPRTETTPREQGPPGPWELAPAAPRRPRRPRPSRQGWAALLGSSLSLLAIALLAFTGYLALLSGIEHSRSQRLAYDDLRIKLSSLTAPTGQTDLDGKLLPVGTPMGYLTAPGLGLEREVFFEGTTSAVLAKGPGHRRASALPGQPGVSTLYGRAAAFGGPFGGLADIDRASIITVTTGQGTHTYEVTGVRREGAPVPSAPQADEGRLTLVTADGPPFAPTGVVYVDARLTSPVVPAAARRLGPSALLPAEAQMVGDSSGWPKIYLLAQGLAVAGLAMAWASRRWGARQAWVAGFPLVGLFVVLGSHNLALLLPNLL